MALVRNLLCFRIFRALYGCDICEKIDTMFTSQRVEVYVFDDEERATDFPLKGQWIYFAFCGSTAEP